MLPQSYSSRALQNRQRFFWYLHFFGIYFQIVFANQRRTAARSQRRFTHFHKRSAIRNRSFQFRMLDLLPKTPRDELLIQRDILHGFYGGYHDSPIPAFFIYLLLRSSQ